MHAQAHAQFYVFMYGEKDTVPALEVLQILSQQIIKWGFGFQQFIMLIIKVLNKVLKKVQH